jgi:hypothetical protein
LILSLCDYTGNWSKPYRDAGYFVEQIDLKLGHDVRLLEYSQTRPHGIIMQPPCTHFAGSGARWWKSKGQDPLLGGLSLVDACLRTVAIYEPDWWVLENPVGRLSKYIGEATFTFDPCEYAGWADDPGAEAYTKRTCLWGKFHVPEKKPVEPVLGSIMHRMYGGASERTKEARSVTPTGFARAFFEANP